MPSLPFADNFTTGAVLTLALPLALLIALAIWYTVAVQHVPADTPASSPALPSDEVVKAAGAGAVSDVTPSGDPRTDESSVEHRIDET